VAAITDYFDGYFARKLQQDDPPRCAARSDRGQAPDVRRPSSRSSSWDWLGLDDRIIIGREFAVSGLRSIAAQHGVTIAASPAR